MRGLISFLVVFSANADDGSTLWLKYDLIQDVPVRKGYSKSIKAIVLTEKTGTSQKATNELHNALLGLLGKDISVSNAVNRNKALILKIDSKASVLSKEGFKVRQTEKNTIITSQTDVGLLYGTFAFIRQIQTLQDISNLHITESPKMQIRMFNHWDKANGTVERGYADSSIWKWFELPERIDTHYIQYEIANASIGINAASINNVNVSSSFLTSEYLEKTKAVSEVLRPYGKVFISVNFRYPRTLGGLEASDPLDQGMIDWWQAKTDEIHKYIPDFGGYLVKANSEGEPGPQDYGRTHADGANMLANTLKGRNGVVIWRSFVYNADINGDRFQEAYNQFKPLDGTFHEKVIVQVQNSPIDFMPREPFHPMFGAFPKTPLAMEFQITQEYLGQSTHLTHLAPMFKEVLDFDTFVKGEDSTVARIIDGSLHEYKISVVAGLANSGSDANWTGHPFGQANWHAFGRLAWNYDLSSEQITKEWTHMTLTKDKSPVNQTVDLMMNSLPTYIKYTYPLGLHHMMGEGNHFGAQPWLEKSGRPDWTSIYCHRADSEGLGFDRTGKPSNALSLYNPAVHKQWNNPTTMDLNYLMWFHHVPWDFKLSTSRTMWNEIMSRYHEGPEEVKNMQGKWKAHQPFIDSETYDNIKGRLGIQYRESINWRDACCLYFKEFSKLPLPAGLKEPDRTLEDMKTIEKIYHLR
jgi:alpha-glucuronidase